MNNPRRISIIFIVVFLLSINLFGGLWMVSQHENNTPPLPTLAYLSNSVNLTATPRALIGRTIEFDEQVATSLDEAFESVQIEHEAVDTDEVENEIITGQVVLEFSDAMTTEDITSYVETLDVEVVDILPDLNRVVIISQSDTLNTIQSETVITTEPDYYARALYTVEPTDPHYPLQWNLEMIGAPQLWDTLPDVPETVRVAVIDSGVCFDHPDMDIIYSDFQYDYVDNDTTPQDEYGHGCSVIGVIASQNNTIGTVGIAPFVEIMSLRVLDENGIGSYSNIARAIVDATNNGANVINLSLGGTQSSNTLLSAVNYALEHGVILVGAVGNSGGATPLYPANYDGVVAVGSVNQAGEISSFNHLGVELFAPGEGILVPHINGDYVVASGTSLATPHLTGVVALRLSSGKNVSPTDSILTRPPIIVNDSNSTSEDPDTPIVIGDMLIPRENTIKRDDADALFTYGSYSVFPWTNGDIYYAFDPGVSAENRDHTRAAMDQWEAVANIRFIPYSGERNYIYIQNGTGNNSYVGMIGGKQELNMVSWEYKYIIVHELGHALGLWHEQSRHDRDDYIYVDYSKVQNGYASAFDKLIFASTVGDYDFASAMHYFDTAFGINGQRTIHVLQPNTAKWQDRIGESAYMSEWDAIGMWAVYPCDDYTFSCMKIPENDFFDNAIDVDTFSFSHSITGDYNTEIATSSVDDPFPSCATRSAKNVWYKIDLPAGHITIDTTGSDYDRAISVWTGERGNLTEVACNYTTGLSFTSDPDETYYVMVSGEYYYYWEIEAGGGNLYFNVEAVPTCLPYTDWLAYPDQPPPVPACAPEEPDNLTATPVLYQEQIDLEWVDNSNDETLFQIERRMGVGSWSVIDSVATDVTTYSDTTVGCYTDYEYRVSAYRADEPAYSDPSNVATVQSSCSIVTPPSNLISSGSLNDIDLDWDDNSPDETTFHIERSPTGANTWAEIGTSPANESSYIDNNSLICGLTYDYRVRTYRDGDTNYSIYSNILTVNLTCDPPTAPSNVTVEPVVTTTNLTIGWQDESSNETNFIIEHFISGTWVDVATVGENVTTYQHTDVSLACYTEYDYRVSSYRSHDDKASTNATVGMGVTSCDTLLAPDNLNVTNSLNTIVTEWSNNSPDGTHFEIERSLTGENSWTTLSTISANTTTYSDNTTICGSTYDYRVRQYRSDDAIYSEYSEIVTALQTCSPPLTPSTLSLNAIPLTQNITLNWGDNAFNETSYEIERSTDGESDWALINSIAADSETYTDTDVNLACYTPYHYRVRAYRSSDGVYSEYTNETNIWTWCEPTTIDSIYFTDSSISDDISGVQGFPIPSCGLNATYAHVWEFTPGENIQLGLNTFGSNFDTLLAIVKNDEYFTEMACNDNGTVDGSSATVASLTGGQSYLVIVSGKNNATGDISFSSSRILPPTPTPLPTDTPVPTATQTPNLTTVGVYKDGFWQFRDSNSSGNADVIIRFGTNLGSDWQPIVGDWNGDGIDGIGLYRNGRWLLRDMVNGTVVSDYFVIFGANESGWKAVVGDWDGDGDDGIGLYKDGNWLLKKNLSDGNADYVFRFKPTNDANAKPIAGDWHNQAVDRVGLYNNGRWYLSYEHKSSNNALAFDFGATDGSWYPIAGDWDEDGDDTIGVYKDGAWRLRNTNSRGTTDIGFTFGSNGGVPVAGYRGGAAALAILAMPADVSLSASEPQTLPSATATLMPTSTVVVEPTETLVPTSTLEPTFIPSPTMTPTATEAPPEIPNNTSGT